MNIQIQEAFFKYHQARFSSETTRSYKMALHQFFSFCQKNYDQIKAEEIRDWLASMDERGLKPSSIQLKLSVVKSFYRYCMKENKLKSNPTLNVRTPQKVDSLPYYVEKRQLALLQELTKDHLRDRAIVEILYSTGVRISELLNIRIEDVDGDTSQIWIRGGQGNKERIVLFS